MENYHVPDCYNNKLSLDWRVKAATKVIDELNNRLKIKDGMIIAVGYSEGGQVVPKLAAMNAKIKKAVCIVGGGLNQFYDFIIQERMNAAKGFITQTKAQQNIDSLEIIFKNIYAHPDATDKFWNGHTYKRWASFCKDVPLNNLLQLDIPILVVTASDDTNSPVLGLDYIPLEFERLGKKNLTYVVYPDCDHSFTNTRTHQDEMNAMMQQVTEWIEK